MDGLKTNSSKNKHVQKSFWSIYQRIVFRNYYFSIYRDFYMRLLLFARGASMIAILASTGILVAFCNNDMVRYICPTIIVIAQIMQTIMDKLPINQRSIECREASLQYYDLQVDAERFWLQIASHKCSNEEIIKGVSFFGKQIVKIEKAYFINDVLPESKRITKKASEECSRYLSLR